MGEKLTLILHKEAAEKIKEALTIGADASRSGLLSKEDRDVLEEAEDIWLTLLEGEGE